MRFSAKFSPLAADYKAPVGSDIFLKMAKAGSPIKFVILGQAVTGFSYWTADNKCIRSRTKFTETPGIRVEGGKTDRVSHFWVLPVWDCNAETVKLLELGQRSIQDQLSSIFDGSDYDLGNLVLPMAIKISAIGEKMLTKYTLMPVPVNDKEFLSKVEAWFASNPDFDVDEIVFAVREEKVEASEPAAPTPTMTPQHATDMM